MSDKSINNDNLENVLESLENATEPLSNDAVTSVEVLKGDTVMYEDGDFEDDFTSEASNMTHDVSEKAVAMMLNRLLDSIDTELEAFDKKVEDSKELVANAEEERNKIADKKDKYQGMIDQLES